MTRQRRPGAVALEWGWRYVLPSLVVVLAFSAAVWLVVLERRRPANVAFALVLGIFGLRSGIGALQTFAIDDGTDELALALNLFWNALGILFFFAVLGFLAVFPRPAGPLGGTVLGRVALALAALIVAGVVLYAPQVLATRELDDDGVGIRTVAVGPVALLGVVPVYGLLAYFLAKEAEATGPGPDRRALLLVSLAAALYIGAVDVRNLVTNVWIYATGREGSLAPSARLLNTAFQVGNLALLALAARAVARLRGEERMPRAWLALAAGALALGVGLALVNLALNTPGRDVTAIDHAIRTTGVVAMAGFPLLTTYALVKHRLFDIDVKIKWTLRRGTVAAIFVGVFIVVEQLVASMLSASVGIVAGAAAAGILFVAIKPLERFADRLADRAMPHTHAPGELSADERRAMYRELARTAWADGTLTRDERQMLETARAKLGLTGDEALAIEREVGA